MPICAEICRAEQKYMPFSGTVPERVFWEKIQSTRTYTNDATLRSGFSALDFPGFTGKGLRIFGQFYRVS